VSYQFTNVGLLIGRKDIRDLTCVENIVDILKEALLLDLGVSEQESGLISFGSDLSHEVLHVLSPLLRPVVLLNFNLEGVEVSHEGRKSSNGLTT